MRVDKGRVECRFFGVKKGLKVKGTGTSSPLSLLFLDKYSCEEFVSSLQSSKNPYIYHSICQPFRLRGFSFICMMSSSTITQPLSYRYLHRFVE